MIKAVIFDMDGLLIDSEPIWRKTHKEVLAELGYLITEDDVRELAGRRTAELAVHWQDRFDFTHPSTEELTNRIVDRVVENVRTHGQPMAGVEKLVSMIDGHDLPMAVASSSSMRLIEVVLERLGIDQYIQVVHSGEHEKRGKPHPDVFISTAKSLHVDPSDCLVFEDSLNGVRAARAAGMKCIAVPEVPFDLSAFTNEKPIKLIDTLEDVRWSDIQNA